MLNLSIRARLLFAFNLYVL